MATWTSSPAWVPYRRALVHVARQLISLQPGERLPTVEDMQRQLAMGAGTVTKALRTLTDSGAVTVDARGSRGTVLLSKDIGALWTAAEYPQLRLAFTPPGGRDHYGLTIGCVEELRHLGIPSVAVFASSGAVRANWVRTGKADAAITSLSAARSLEAGRGLSTVDLSPARYYGEEQLVVVSRRAGGSGKLGYASSERDDTSTPTRSRLRVGVDLDSPDHVHLTEQEFGPDAQHVDCAFRDIPAAVLSGRIDAGVWHRIDAPITPELAGLDTRPVTGDDAPAAVLVRDRLIHELMSALDAARIAHVQGDVMGMGSTDEVQTRLWGDAVG